jgi:DNA polymerase-3 subunit beta
VRASGSASESQTAIRKRLKVVCGANTSYLEDLAWIGQATSLSLCQVRVSPYNRVQPNLGATELSEALSRVLPFTAKEDTRPVLKCVLFRVKDGILSLVSADGYRLAVVKLDFEGEDGEVLVSRDDLRGIPSALKRARRVRLSLEKSGESLDGMSLVLDTELVRYKWRGVKGEFPNYEGLVPTQFNTLVSFDTSEAIRAVNSLKVLSEKKSYPIDLTVTSGKLVMSSPDEKGQVDIPADTQGEGQIRLEGSNLAEALRACGGMVELRLVNAQSAMVFAVDGYELVTMPMYTPTSQKPAEPVKAEASQPPEPPTTEEADKARAVAEAEAITKAKPKRKHGKAREPVAVA